MLSPIPTLLLLQLALTASAEYGAPIREDDGPLIDGLRTQMSPHRRRLVLIHAIFAVAAWMFFAPVAIITARYLKFKLPPGRKGGMGRRGNGKMWFKIHFGFNLFTLVCMVTAFILGYYAVGGPSSPYQFLNPHTRIGTAVMAATGLQAIIGVLNHWALRYLLPTSQTGINGHTRTSTPPQNKIHILLGWLTWGLGVSNIPVGMVLYGCATWLFIVYGACLGGYLVLLIGLEGFWGRNHGEGEEVVMEKEAEGSEEGESQSGESIRNRDRGEDEREGGNIAPASV